MGKGKRRAFNDPAKQLGALQKSSDDVIKAFGGKGFTTDIIDDGWIKARGHYYWRGGKGFYSEAGSWDTEELKKLIDKTKLTTYTDEDGNSQTENNADTTEDWANKWAEENGL